ncbi:MAG: hypothetical protein SVX43_09390 [Cyanobacteriota bacterium]|nr:hypothetical protein [Cyanobacteriota bacterium]
MQKVYEINPDFIIAQSKLPQWLVKLGEAFDKALERLGWQKLTQFFAKFHNTGDSPPNS